MSAAAVMMRDFTYCHPRDVLQDVLSIMKERGFVQIPIIDQDSGPSAAPLRGLTFSYVDAPVWQLVQKRPTSKAMFG
jgi:CBS domain-containing protein